MTAKLRDISGSCDVSLFGLLLVLSLRLYSVSGAVFSEQTGILNLL